MRRRKALLPPHYTHPAVFLLWGHTYQSLFPALCRNALYEVMDYFVKPVFLAEVHDHRLVLVDIHSRLALSVPLRIAEHRLFYLEMRKVLCVGDELQCRGMHLLSFFPLLLTQLPEMHQWCCLRTYAYYKRHVYVFQDTHMESEKYSLATQQWTVIPHSNRLDKMPAFTVVWKEICLMHIAAQRMLEFDFRSEEMRELKMQTPLPWCCLVAHSADWEHQVLLLCKGCDLVLLNLAELTFERLGAPAHPWHWPRTNGFAKMVGQTLFWLEPKPRQLRCLNTVTMEKKAMHWLGYD